MSRAALLAAVAADPAADLPRLVFADWCDDHGEAGRAEFIRLQVQTARTDPTDPGWLPAKLREYELFDRHWAAKRKDIAHPPLARTRPAGPAVWAPTLDSLDALEAVARSAPPADALRLGFVADADEYGEAMWWGEYYAGHELAPLGELAERLAPTAVGLAVDATLTGEHLGVLFAVPCPGWLVCGLNSGSGRTPLWPPPTYRPSAVSTSGFRPSGPPTSTAWPAHRWSPRPTASRCDRRTPTSYERSWPPCPHQVRH